MFVTVSVAPVNYPIDFELLKEHLVIEHDQDETLLDAYIAGVVSQLDPPYGFLGRSMITQTLQYWVKEFPSGHLLKLPFPPLQSVSSVKYYDDDEVLQTMSAGDYSVITHTEPGYIELGYDDEEWPTDLSDRKYPIVIEYVAGYGDTYADVPMGLRLWMMMTIADTYMQREHLSMSTLNHNRFTLNQIENYRFYFHD